MVMSDNPWSSVMPGGVPFAAPVPDEETDGSDTDVSTDVDTTPAPEYPHTSGPATGGLPVRPATVPVTAPATAPVLPTNPPAAPAPEPAADTEPEIEADEDEGAAGSVPGPVAAEWSVTDEDEEDGAPPVARLPFLPGSPLAPLPATRPDPQADKGEGEGDPVTPPPAPAPDPVPAPADEGDEAGEGVGVTTDTPTPATAPVLPAPSVPVTTVEADGMQVNPTTGEVLTPASLPVTPAPAAPAPVESAPVEPAPVEPAPVVPVVPLTPPDPAPRVVADVGEDWDPEALLSDSAEAEAERKQAKAEKRKAKAKKGKGAAIALTERDIAMFQFLARYRFATYPQLARYFNTTPVALRQRMPRLSKEGFLVRKPIGKSQHGVWLPTSTAIKVSGMDLPVPNLSWATAAHTLGLVDIGIMYELEGEQVVTEREIRAADQRDRPSPRMQAAMRAVGLDPDEPIEDGSSRLYVIPLGSGESHYGHIPDMVLVRPNNPDGSAASVAVELELNHKPATQWRKIMRAYLKAPNIGQVIYYTPQRKIAAGIVKAAQEMEAEHMVQVRRFTPSESSVIVQMAG